MNEYKIYQSAAGQAEAVKIGRSFPAMFFVWAWAFTKRMWTLGVLTMALYIFLATTITYSDGWPNVAAKVLIAIVSGMFLEHGNAWRERTLLSRLYSHKDTLNAAGPKEALSLFQKKQTHDRDVHASHGELSHADVSGVLRAQPEQVSVTSNMESRHEMRLAGLEECVVVKAVARSWSSDNSVVNSMPALAIRDIWDEGCLCSVGASLVRITGPSEEQLHFYTSHLYGLIVRGAGILRYRPHTVTAEKQLKVSESDLVIIPKGINHLFECSKEETMYYVALELSDRDIDYQKHWR